jgi:hypothetical protein
MYGDIIVLSSICLSTTLSSIDAPRFNPVPDTYRVGLKNASIELSCRVRANPKAKITWLKSRTYVSSRVDARSHTIVIVETILRSSHRVHLLNDSQILRLTQLRHDDAGVYTCVVENILQRITASTDLRIRDPSSCF